MLLGIANNRAGKSVLNTPAGVEKLALDPHRAINVGEVKGNERRAANHPHQGITWSRWFRCSHRSSRYPRVARERHHGTTGFGGLEVRTCA